jgi:hypothetical protein
VQVARMGRVHASKGQPGDCCPPRRPGTEETEGCAAMHTKPAHVRASAATRWPITVTGAPVPPHICKDPQPPHSCSAQRSEPCRSRRRGAGSRSTGGDCAPSTPSYPMRQSHSVPLFPFAVCCPVLSCPVCPAAAAVGFAVARTSLRTRSHGNRHNSISTHRRRGRGGRRQTEDAVQRGWKTRDHPVER